MSVEIEQSNAETGRSRVFLKVRLRNTSPSVVHLEESAREFDYRIDVTDASGYEPPRTDWGERLLRGEVTMLRHTVLDLDPGKEIDVRVEVTKTYYLRRLELYTVKVTRLGLWAEPVEDNLKSGEIVVSKPIRFEVAP
jgi:hypothetical protein